MTMTDVIQWVRKWELTKDEMLECKMEECAICDVDFGDVCPVRA